MCVERDSAVAGEGHAVLSIWRINSGLFLQGHTKKYFDDFPCFLSSTYVSKNWRE